MPFDTLNKFMVGSQNGRLVILNNGPILRGGLSNDDALNLAAYLVVLSGKSREELEEALAAIEAT